MELVSGSPIYQSPMHWKNFISFSLSRAYTWLKWSRKAFSSYCRSLTLTSPLPMLLIVIMLLFCVLETVFIDLAKVLSTTLGLISYSTTRLESTRSLAFRVLSLMPEEGLFYAFRPSTLACRPDPMILIWRGSKSNYEILSSASTITVTLLYAE